MKPKKKQSVMREVQHGRKKNRKRRISITSAPESKKSKAVEMSSEDESASVSPKVVNLEKSNKSQENVKGRRRVEMLQANREEDKVINRLENLLGVKKRRKRGKLGAKKLPSAFTDDGLDYILEVLDSVPGKDSDSDEDLPEQLDNKKYKSFCKDDARKGSNKKRKNTFESEENDELSDDSYNSSQCSEEGESEMSDVDDDDISDDDGDQDDDLGPQSTRNVKAGAKDCETDESDVDTKKPEVKKQKPKVWEDIYGRLRDAEGNVLPNPTAVSQLYVPPHERKKQETVSDERKASLERMGRHLKGLINRLSESNMNRICNEVEEMYMKNSRNDMNETLMSILSAVLLLPTAVPPRFAMEQAMLIALLHGNIGSEIGAFFLQNLALKIDEFLKSQRNCEQGKECSNLLTFLCHLCIFKVTHSLLIFDILRSLVESFQEVDIELILLILKYAGFTLRKDDPLAFKEFLISAQSKAAALKPEQNQSRVKFMLDILIEMRNNNMEKMKKLLHYDPSITERLKKVLRSLVHKGKYIQELSISYEDLLKAHERGRWWIVGSAWSEGTSKSTSDAVSDPSSVDSSITFNDKFLRLSKMLHINTETRKMVFNIIMTAQDYMDAFESLLRLELKNQEREIISVLLHCSLQEKNFNPYYAYLASKFCKYERRFRWYLKFALWEKFKELESMKSSQRDCLVSLLVHLFTTESMDISVLKVIHFSEMKKTMIQFFRKTLTAVLLHEREEVCYKVFQRISSNTSLHLLRESLRLFMHHFILRRKSQMDDSVAQTLTKRVKLAEDALNSAKHAFKL